MQNKLRPTRRQIDKGISNIVYCLTFPMVGHPMWATAIPEDFRQQMPIIRMVQLMKEPDTFQEQATNEEAMAYIMTASLAFPLNSDWTDIYMYLTRKYLLTWKKTKLEDLPDFLQKEITLDDYRTSMLRRLKGWIRKKQIQHIKTREKEACPTIEDKPPENLLTWL